MDYSIVLCTRNRCDRLADAFRSFAQLAKPVDADWEFIIVDNGSTDATPALCRQYVEAEPQRYQYVHVARPGKSVALNRGIAAAQGRILVFTDDDCLVTPTWIQQYHDEFQADSTLALLGGRVELYNPDDQPMTLATGTTRAVFRTARSLFPNPPIIGANMAVRREVFSTIGGYDELMGPGTGAVAEDADLLYRALKAGFSIVYSPAILVYHNHGRQTAEEVRQLGRKYDAGRGSFYWKHVLAGDLQVTRMLLGDLKSTVLQILTLNNVRYRLNFLGSLLRGAVSRLHFRPTRENSSRTSPADFRTSPPSTSRDRSRVTENAS